MQLSYIPPHRRTGSQSPVALRSAARPFQPQSGAATSPSAQAASQTKAKSPQAPRQPAAATKPGPAVRPVPPVPPRFRPNLTVDTALARASMDSDPGAEAFEEVAWAQMLDIAEQGQDAHSLSQLQQFVHGRFLPVAKGEVSLSAAAQWQAHVAEAIHLLYGRAHLTGEDSLFAAADALAVLQARGKFLTDARRQRAVAEEQP